MGVGGCVRGRNPRVKIRRKGGLLLDAQKVASERLGWSSVGRVLV